MFEDIRYVSAGKFISRDAWIHTKRTMSSHELIFPVSGQVHIALGDQPYVVNPGEMLHIAPGVLHQGTQVSTSHISFYWVHFIGDAPQIPILFRQADPSRTEILCRQLLHCAQSPGYPRDCADYFVRLLLIELIVQQNADHAATNVLCASVEEWIRGNCTRPIKVTDVANYFNFNPDYLNRVFRRYHPEGLKTYINKTRLQLIRQALASTDQTLQQISRQFGFQDYKYFLKYFRFHEGVTPTEFRNAYYQEHINWR